MPETLIHEVPELGAFQSRMEALGYRTTKQLAGALEASGEALGAYLHTEPAALKALLGGFEDSPAAAAAPAPERPRATGVRLDRIPRMTRAFALSAPRPAAALPAVVNMIAEMRPVRDQGTRGTCVAHACTAVAEHYWGGQGRTVDLSRQFLYWDCKQHDGEPNNVGTWVGVAMPRLQADGCCLETDWPYVSDPIPGNESQDPPPDGAVAAAASFAVPGYRQLSPTGVDDIRAELAGGRCVAFSIPVFASWYNNNEVTRTGEIVNPIPNEPVFNNEGHAMCFVGYEDLPGSPELGGGRFYLRNSWNGFWATESVLNVTGYGTIPYSYIARFGTEAYSIG